MLANQIIIGTDDFQIRAKVKQLIAQFIGDSGQKPVIQKIILGEKAVLDEKLLQMNAFWSATVLVIDHFELVAKWAKKKRDYLNTVLNSNALPKIIISREVIKAKTSKIAIKGDYHYLPKMTKLKKQKYILEFLNQNNIRYFATQVVNSIADSSPNDYAVLHQNLQKIATWFKQNPKPLETKHVEQILNNWPNDNIFSLIEAIICNQQTIMWKKLANIPATELNLMFILKLLNTFLVLLLQVKALLKERASFTAIVQKLKRSSFLIRKLMVLSRSCSNTWAQKILETVQEWEFKSRKLQIAKSNMVQFFLIDLYNGKTNKPESF